MLGISLVPIASLSEKNTSVLSITPVKLIAPGPYENTGIMVRTMIPVFSYGPGAINFTGVIDNTDVFFSLKEAIGTSEIPSKECNLN